MNWLSLIILLGLLVFLGFQIKDLILLIKEKKKAKQNQNNNKEDSN